MAVVLSKRGTVRNGTVMISSSAIRAVCAVGSIVFALNACTRVTDETGAEPVTSGSSVSYGNFGPKQPGSGFSGGGTVIAGNTGVFGTTDQITVDDSGPFPDNSGSFDSSLSDLSADDQALLAGTGIDLEAEAALAATLSFSGDDGSTAFFDADIGNTVYFETNSSQLTDAARETLRSQAAWLNVHPDVVATVEGHTDERGTREFNIALGERRASSVRGYLTALGVPGERVRKVSYGKERPAVPGSDESAWAQNRRVVTVLERQSGGLRSPGAALSGAGPQTRLGSLPESSVDDLLNDPVLNDIPAGDPLLNDPLLNDPLLNDPLLNDL